VVVAPMVAEDAATRATAAATVAAAAGKVKAAPQPQERRAGRTRRRAAFRKPILPARKQLTIKRSKSAAAINSARTRLWLLPAQRAIPATRSCCREPRARALISVVRVAPVVLAARAGLETSLLVPPVILPRSLAAPVVVPLA
jgi:hypothetical protein